jgi:hypothetical protein
MRRLRKRLKSFFQASGPSTSSIKNLLQCHQKRFGVLIAKVCNCVDLLKIIPVHGPHNFISQLYAAKAFAVLGVVPGEESGQKDAK